MNSNSSAPDRSIDVWRVNAFTARRFTGNPAGVVPDGDGLPDHLMLAIAGELNDVSETVFICRPSVADADVRLRFFTTTTEVDLCGHATISALFTLGWLKRIKGGDETRTIRAQTPVGVLETSLQFVGGEPAWAGMEQLAPQTHEAPGATLAPEILGLSASALSGDFVTACASTGLWACFVPLNDVSALQDIHVERDRIVELWPENPDFTGIYPFAFVDDNTTQGRFFSPPEFGIVEDPVTGTACGALGGYLLAQGGMPKSGELIACQGIEMGREGMVKVRCNTNGKMQIQGQAVSVFRGKMVL